MSRKKETQEKQQERYSRWAMLMQKALMATPHPAYLRHYGQNVVVRVPTPMIGKLYGRNGAKECARRRKQMGTGEYAQQ